MQRPELAERQAAIREALLALSAAKVLPFSPNVIVGYSAGTFGGGSNLAAEGAAGAPAAVALRQLRRPHRLRRRRLLDGAATSASATWRWSAWRRATCGPTTCRQLEVLDRVRTEVATAYARTHARFAQIETSERAVRTGAQAFQEDLVRAKNKEAHPIEVLDSLRLLRTSRYDLLDAISAYNRAQFELYVALGQPPADVLARPVPADLVPPPPPSSVPNPGVKEGGPAR